MVSDAKMSGDTEKIPDRSASPESRAEIEHRDHSGASGSLDKVDEETRKRIEASQKLANPLAGIGQKQLADMGEDYAREAGLTSDEDIRAFRIGAMIAGNENKYDTIAELTDHEREILDREDTHKWSNPKMLYWVIVSKSTLPIPLNFFFEERKESDEGPQSARSVRPSKEWTRR